MDAEISRSGGFLSVRPRGRLAKEEADGLLASIAPGLAGGVRGLLLDLSEVDYMTSAALGVVISMLQKVRSGGGRMAVAAPGERVHLLLEVAGLNQLLALCKSREEAERLLCEEGPEA